VIPLQLSDCCILSFIQSPPTSLLNDNRVIVIMTDLRAWVATSLYPRRSVRLGIKCTTDFYQNCYEHLCHKRPLTVPYSRYRQNIKVISSRLTCFATIIVRLIRRVSLYHRFHRVKGNPSALFLTNVFA